MRQSAKTSSHPGRIFVGIGGWTFAPWRGDFYPKGLTQKKELEYASRQVTSIEINGTFYGSQKPESFARWHDETPDDFVFALKGPRFATHRRVLAEAGESIDRFLQSGVTALKHKLGPINWQFAPTKRFEPEDFEAFLKLLPKRVDGQSIRHAVELRHESFAVPACISLLRHYGVAVVGADEPTFPSIFDTTAPFVYVRLQTASEQLAAGYAPKTLDAWAKRARLWSDGGSPPDVHYVGNDEDAHAREGKQGAQPREVFIYMINGFKPKAPAAARALIARLE